MIAPINPPLQRWLIELLGATGDTVPAEHRIEKLLRSAKANYGLEVVVRSRPIQDAGDYLLPFGPHEGEKLLTVFRCCTDYSDGLSRGAGLQLAESFAIRKAGPGAKNSGEFTAVIDALRQVAEWDRDCERIWATTWRTGTIPTLPTPPEAARTMMPEGSEYAGQSVWQIYRWNLAIFFGLADGAHLPADGVNAVAALVRCEDENGFLVTPTPIPVRR